VCARAHTHTHTHVRIRGVSEIGRHILDSLAVDQNIMRAHHMNSCPRTFRFFVMVTVDKFGRQFYISLPVTGEGDS
jgi:hypothetical protein